MLELYSYYLSSAAYRVRIALALKGLDHNAIALDLLSDGGAQHGADFLAKNPQGLVPLLATEQGFIAQSVSIIEYLEEICPHPSLLPGNSFERAQLRSLAFSIACDIHPLNNLRVLQYLERQLDLDQAARSDWYQEWVGRGFRGIESMLGQLGSNGRYCVGDNATIADCLLIPQVYNAKRFECPLDDYPLIQSINDHCLSLTEFDGARPENQPDAVSQN